MSGGTSETDSGAGPADPGSGSSSTATGRASSLKNPGAAPRSGRNASTSTVTGGRGDECDGHGTTPRGAAASIVPSARRTASSTVRSTCHRSRNRTSAFAGWTLTSTASAATTKSSKGG